MTEAVNKSYSPPKRMLSFTKKEARANLKSHWNGLLMWTSECQTCPLLFFNGDHAENCNTNMNRSDVEGADARRRMMQVKAHLADNEFDPALQALLELTKLVNYRLSERELTLLIRTAEIVVRNRLHIARQMTLKDMSHAIGFVKANIRRASMSRFTTLMSQEEIVADREELSNLLLTLVDVIQTIRFQRGGAFDAALSSEPRSLETDPSSSDTIKVERFDCYLTLFSLLIQSAFLEAGLVSGSIFVSRLLSNAEEVFYMIHDSKNPDIDFLKPLAAYIYGRLWCEVGDNSAGALCFLENFYKKGVEGFDKTLPSSEQPHSPVACSMRLIYQTLRKHHHSM